MFLFLAESLRPKSASKKVRPSNTARRMKTVKFSFHFFIVFAYTLKQLVTLLVVGNLQHAQEEWRVASTSNTTLSAESMRYNLHISFWGKAFCVWFRQILREGVLWMVLWWF
jgi:hypothetical protein